ncbi:type II toxin-antitoxin system prevent-host-death family antitoxin [Spirulina sp. CS-785/01]|uniref:type II toxin-antitoxin system Phd/YefM family antitoxin n=1 Tax=Spirulina sp. CS-785/01 TaxID=3021716 RepID=UPI00232FBF8B|nr:type II toxin-antitoxin system prevent-host-death family antitoxin [Spirulina sp. CS-785/01]MDB9311858.1 type II toxin-antitoxin system prevent-host-death family antitoxin [Spirulina sp. CS-785/01]
MNHPKKTLINHDINPQTLEQIMDQVCHDNNPVIVTRNDKSSVVIMSLEDYQSFQETAYLLSSSKNAKRLFESIAELEAGQGVERELLE